MTLELPATIKVLNVALHFATDDIPVGRLLYREHKIYFEYDPAFLQSNFELSPFHLPKRQGVQQFDPSLFHGLPGVFNDSLPDGWGRLLLDRAVRTHGIQPDSLTPIDRLAHVGRHGMGALIYEPDFSDRNYPDHEVDLNNLAAEANKILTGSTDIVFDELLAINGSSAGARPKALIGVNKSKDSLIHGVFNLPSNYEYWLVKFSNSQENIAAGAIEYVYSQMAKLANIEMTETYLFPSKKSAGYYATKRFDRKDGHRLHLHSACGLLHSNFRTPSLDYEDLIKLTILLTKDLYETEKMYRLAVFNVLAHNQDDHSKNFSFLMDESAQWRLSPAYDLTFSSGLGGEQSTMVMGSGKNISRQQLINLSHAAELDERQAIQIIEQTQDALSQWSILAKQAGVDKYSINMIEQLINAQQK